VIKPSTCPVALIAADDILREALGMSLSARGFAVSSFPSVAAFLDERRTAKAQCLVVDLIFDDHDRLEGDPGEVIRRIKAEDPRLPVILLTGLQHEDAALNRSDILLTKPVEPGLISKLILKAAAGQSAVPAGS
jgi:FixJ family two-component response regulator